MTSLVRSKTSYITDDLSVMHSETDSEPEASLYSNLSLERLSSSPFVSGIMCGLNDFFSRIWC